MKLFSDCSGPCWRCKHNDGGCLAGHGDDHFSSMSLEEVKEKFHSGKKISDRYGMFLWLKENGYDPSHTYDSSKGMRTPKDVMINGKSLHNILLDDSGKTDYNLNFLDLSYIDFTKCKRYQFSHIDIFLYTNLSHCKFHGCDLSNMDLINCDMSYSNFYWVDFKEANFRDSNLTGASFESCNCDYCDFLDANLTDTIIRCSIAHSRFAGCKTNENTVIPYYPMVCPEEGEFIAFTDCEQYYLAKILVPADAIRVSSPDGVCRCNKVKVLEIFTDYGVTSDIESVKYRFDDNIRFKVGETVAVDNFDTNELHVETGILFGLDRESANHLYQY